MGGFVSKIKYKNDLHITNTRDQNPTKSKYSNMEEKYPAGKMSIYFGSQTGTAMSFAKTLSGQFRKNGFDVRVIGLGDFNPDQLFTSRIAIFLVATYGEGNPTDNALNFYEWLCNSKGEIPSNFLSNVSYAVFGLGNSTYVHYNQMGKDCNEKLEKIGGKRIFPFACGDDSCTLEEDFEKWKGEIVPFLTQKYLPVNESSVVNQCQQYCKAHLTFQIINTDLSKSRSLKFTEINTATKYFFNSSILTLQSIHNLRDNNDNGKTFHIEFDISNSNLKYNPADNLAIVPENDKNIVEMFSRCCGGYNLSQNISLISTPSDPDVEIPHPEDEFRHSFPNPCTINTIFTKYLDICGIPRKSTLERFAAYVRDSQQLKWLENLISRDNRELFTEYIEKEGKTFASLLSNELSSCIIPLEDLLHLIPFIQPRYYTISSSSSVYPNSIHLTVTLLQRRSPSGKIIDGLCTKFLSSLKPGSTCRAFTRESVFKLPESLEIPIIMVGPGSGIAPMRALLQEREFQAQKQEIPFENVQNILYFGCKSRALDYLYQDELKNALNQHVLTDLKVAFSREQNEKIYVQNLLKLSENSESLYNLIEKGAHIFVCGATSMGAAVAESFAVIISNHKGITIEEARNFIKESQKNKTYKQELWSV